MALARKVLFPNLFDAADMADASRSKNQTRPVDVAPASFSRLG
jgi:hypothetical protein